jgi:hypothetical protein
MKSIDSTRLEILKMARELTINEYIDRRAQEHNEWLDKSSELWKTQRLALAYPVIPPYPTEKEIIARAKALMDFLLTSDTEEDSSDYQATEVKVSDVDTEVEFVSEAEYSNLESIVAETIDKSFDAPPTDEKYASKLPQIMKGVQDIRRLIGNKK